MPFVVLYDTDVLFPNAQRDLLIRIGLTGLVQARWSEKIVDDLAVVLARERPGMKAAKLARLKS